MTADDRDPAVASLLDRLAAPPPRPGFWDDVARRLQAEAAAPADRDRAGAPPDGVVELTPSPRWPGSPRRRVLVAVAAAVVLVGGIVAAGLVVGGDDEGLRTGPANPGPTTPSTDGAPAAGWASTPATDTVRRWVEAIDAGDADAAWALLGPQSQDQLGSRAAFDDLMASALREGWGAWASATDLQTAEVPFGSGADDAWLVSLAGVVPQEGPPAWRGAALAVRVADDGSGLVEPLAPGTALGLIDGPAGPVGPSDPIGVHVPGDAAAFVVAIDGSALTEDRLERDAAGDIVAVHPDPPLTPGMHTIAVAYVTPEGSLAVDAVDLEARR